MAESDNDNSDFEIEDVENWRGGEEKRYSHQLIIMQAIDLCMRNGSTELRDGIWNTKLDKNGNVIKTYEPNTRKIFIESVKSLIMLTHRDWKDDSYYRKKIEEVEEDIEERKNFWKGEEWKWWCSLSYPQQQMMIKQNRQVTKGLFNQNNDFDNLFNEEEVNYYRKIVSLICDFIKDKMRDYEGEVLTG